MTAIYFLAAGAAICVAAAIILMANSIERLADAICLHADRIDRLERDVKAAHALARKRLVAGKSGR